MASHQSRRAAPRAQPPWLRLAALASLLAVLALLAGCARAAPRPALPVARSGAVLSGYNVGSRFRHNALTLFDPATWQVLHRVELPRSWAKQLARDPDGRWWVGLSGSVRESDTRLDVYGPDGALVKTLHPCTDSEAGVSFAADRAFVAFAEDGFRGKVPVISLRTLAVVHVLELAVPGSHLLLVASAASEAAVVVVGGSDGEGPAQQSVVTVIDPRALTVVAQLPLGPGSDVWRIIPRGDRFYSLNVASGRQPLDQARKVLVLKPGDPPRVAPVSSARAPLWGAIDGDGLWAYHNPVWNQPSRDPRRWISRLDLASGTAQTWPLPDGRTAGDLAIVDGQVILAHWTGHSDAEDGLYGFDPATGQLTRVLQVTDASFVLGPSPTPTR